MDLTSWQLGLLLCAALLSGIVDAIGGGGGLVTLPVLLYAGIPPHLALGTNKGQSVFGSGTALLRYARAGLVDRTRAKLAFPLGFVGSLLGAALVLQVSPARIQPLVAALLVFAAVALLVQPLVLARQRRRAGGTHPAIAPRPRTLLAAGLSFAIAAYDGFFGPGTGTFLIAGSVLLLGQPIARASADAKVVNFASNLAAMILFAWRGTVLWKVALPMAAAQALGAVLGAWLAVRGGDRLVRPVVLAIALALALKLVLS